MENPSICQNIGSGITLIDAGYLGPGVAACYLIEEEGEAALIETGISFTLDRVESLLRDKGLENDAIKYVIPTHVHLDHAGGAGMMMAAFPQARLVIHPRGARHMVDPAKLVAAARAVYGREWFDKTYGEIPPIAEERIIIADEGFSLTLGERELRFMETPGHANHHFMVWDERTRGWFTGDTFGLSYPEMRCGEKCMVIPSSTPTQFSPEKMLNSIARVMAANPAVAYLTHFGPITTLDEFARQLRHKIPLYCEIAERCSKQADGEAAIARELLSFEMANLLAVNPDLGEEKAAAVLAMDMKLNAQGLFHWVTNPVDR